MRKSLKVLFGTLITSSALVAALTSCGGGEEKKVEGPVLYVSPTADLDGGEGTKEKPYEFTQACKKATPNTTILLAAGTYDYGYRLEIGKDIASDAETETGRPGNYITVKPETEDARVVFDFSKMRFDSNNRGIQIYSNFWHFYGIEITGAGDNGMYVAGSHNIIENCQFYNNRDTGLQLGRAYNTDNTIDYWPSYNLIKNCTSFDNYDAETYGENADGYAAKLTVGYGNVFDGCIAFRNSDDGWDLFAKVDSGDIGTVILYNCVSFENGFLSYKNDNQEDSKFGTYDTLNGDGIGFKLGGSVMKGNVIVENCLAFNNKLHGVGDNSNPGVISVKNFTAFNNCANVDAEGKVTATRGLPDIANKSNNIDLARSTNSYNNYYGIVSYINNQENFSVTGDSEYNKDAFRGSTAYSIFNTGYNNGEVYKAFTGYEDASSWHSESTDTEYSGGTTYRGMSDSVFADLSPINAVCDDRASLTNLLSIHTTYRNSDKSVNMGNKIKIVDENLLKYADGKPIGAQLSKSSYSEYTHYSLYTFETGKDYNDDELRILSAYSVTEVIANKEAVFQNFILPKQIAKADIFWESSNKDVIEIDTNEIVSLSDSVFCTALVHVPATDTKVTLTATISSGNVKTQKQIEVTVKSRSQNLGELVSNAPSAIRVNLYGTYVEPSVHALDASAITISEFPLSLYDLTNTYKYATDRNSKFYNIDGVYTSVAGVYEVTATATLKSDPSVKSSLVYRVYVVDPDSSIDFTGEADITLSSSGFDVTGSLSNIEGSVIAITSPTELTTLKTAQDLLAHTGADGKSDVQEVKIVTDTIVASFTADNSSLVEGDTQYYIYYAVVNGNKSAKTNNNTVYTKQIKVSNVTTKDDFYNLARFGKLGTESDTQTTIYSLTQDLDFTGYEWNPAESVSSKPVTTFSGLFKGNNHTISNISIDSENAGPKSLNIFYKLSNGTIMDVKFSDITLTGDTANSKQVGIVGEMQGGYLHNIYATKINASGKESVGGIVGQITGGDNHITRCVFVNPIPATLTTEALLEKSTTEDILTLVNSSNQYQITVANKYAGGIIGNAQMNSDQKSLGLYISECYASGIIGDGKDAAGNMGLILGRCKNDNDAYQVVIDSCVAYGLLVSKGQYTAGIVGDFDNALGHVTIQNCLAEPSFIYQMLYLNAAEALKENLDAQNYAHKNSNPIVGRAVATANDGEYITKNNIGSWTEYYTLYVDSVSLVFDLSDTEEGLVIYTLTQGLAESRLGFDFEKVWNFTDGVVTPRWVTI